jgi:hypothetical protein
MTPSGVKYIIPTIYYVSKYALGDGRLMVIDSDTHAGKVAIYEKYLTVKTDGQHGGLFVSPSHYTTDRAEAVRRAEKERARKLASLKKQIARISAIDFGAQP